MIRFKTKLSICVATSLLITMPGYARQLSLEEALQHAPNELISTPTRSNPELLHTEKSGNLNVAYIISSQLGEGYVVLSADDVLPAVLGYSDTGTFNPASIPPAMEMWLSEYGRQLEYAVENGISSPIMSTRATRNPISPLCKATWNQSQPFNNNCPSINGKKAPTGCTATAMAQVIYAHKWPVTGTGTNTYLSGTYRQKLTFDFGATTFDWANMLPSYASGYNEQQAAAVATLMEACGNAALMSYGDDASGAYPYDATYGMVKFMGYDKSAIMTERDYYTSSDWDAMIYSELANGRPVIYGGYNSSYQNGHTFIVDGYSENGFYHLNWGWGGMSNGYFLLTALDPAEQGIGGSASGYNFRQDAIINIMPAKEDSNYQMDVMWNGPFNSVNKAYTSMGSIEFTPGKEGYYKAFTLETRKIIMGIKITPEDGGETLFVEGSEAEFPSYYGDYQSITYNNFKVPVASLPETGTFIATPAFKVDGEVKDVSIKVGETRSVKITRTRTGGVQIVANEVARTLTADDIKIANTLYSGKSCSITATIHNSGEEYLGMVKAGFENAEGTILTMLNGVPINLADGASTEVSFSGVLNSFENALEPGNYILNIYDEAGNSICENPVNVTVMEAPAGRPVYEIDFKVVGNDTGDGTNFSPYLIGDHIDMEVTVSVTSGLFEDRVALYAFYGSYDYADFTSSTSYIKNFFVGPGQKQTQTYNLGTSLFNLNEPVYIRAYGWNNDLSEASLGYIGKFVYVKRTSDGVDDVISDNAGIYPNPAISTTTVTSSHAINEVIVYSITGTEVIKMNNLNGAESVEINVSPLSSGNYIVIANTSNGVERHRLIKK